MSLSLRARLIGALLAGSLASGCGGGEDDGLAPTATIGAGEIAFADLQDGGTASVILGPQGGFHIIGSVRVTGIETGDPNDLSAPNNPTTRFTLERGGVRVDADGASYTQGLDPVGDGVFEMVGRIVILDILADDELDGETLDFTVVVTDTGGVTVTDSVQVIARPDPRNP